MSGTPEGFKLKHRLDGGGREVEGTFIVHSRFWPLRRRRIKRARTSGDLREVFELIVKNSDDFDLDSWDGSYYRHIVPMLLDETGLNR